MDGSEEQRDSGKSADYDRLQEMAENLAEAVAALSASQPKSRGIIGSVKKVNSFIVGLAGLAAAVVAIYQAGKTALNRLDINVSTKGVNSDKIANDVVRQWHNLDHWRTHMAWWQIVLIFVVAMVSIHNSQYGESPVRTGLLCALLIWVLWATTPVWGLVLMVIAAVLMILWMEIS